MKPEEMQARVLYRDGLMLVIDKPAGLPVHRGPKGGASLEDFFDALRFGLPRPPALAHRLDKETSGCLVLGRHRKALAHLGLLFKHGKVGKTYWAVVEGGPDEDTGVIDLPLGRLDQSRGWWMKPDPHGQPAVTKWAVLGRSVLSSDDGIGIRAGRMNPRELLTSQLPGLPPPPLRGRAFGEGGRSAASETAQLNQHPPPGELRSPTSPSTGEVKKIEAAATIEPPAFPKAESASPEAEGLKKLSWLALEPLTGRTHQLRVHCAAMGWPIVGDNIYGSAPRFGGPGLHLHAREIVVPLAKNKEPVCIVAPVPAHMRDLLRACGFADEAEPKLSAVV
jgi:tRNA pseudouridine32 synthase/23S rRNA pseudouridine746 synthase